MSCIESRRPCLRYYPVVICKWLIIIPAPAPTNVRYAPNSDQILRRSEKTLSAKSRQMHCSKQHLYSITSVALVSSAGGTSRPSAFAVLRLITNSNLVGNSIGRSLGFSPFKILSTNVAARR
jgi:hypothetical protein